MSVNSKMTAIADPIRVLKGEKGKMGLDAMASNLGEVVNECDTQADLIQQIKTALADKAAGGVELPTLDNEGTADDLARGKQLIDADGSVVEGNVLTVTDYKFSTIENNNPTFDDGDGFGITHIFTENTLFREGSQFTPCVDYGRFGNATPDKVAKGATFTSASGVLIEGTNAFRDIKTITIEEVQ